MNKKEYKEKNLATACSLCNKGRGGRVYENAINILSPVDNHKKTA